MSGVKRYWLEAYIDNFYKAHQFVLASDYDALQKRYRELEAENADLQAGILAASHFADSAHALRAEVERLREHISSLTK